ncbi:polysaccharide pyruvyl transferase family protein [Synechococcus sp. BA-132 BA5]|uniref:polysaccharide pyruvyl transferase family protein n=1 Tax=Synechococcus sp. BA-132 BA5 TaxID=3110252 RepID=UPI002B202203|nr:polysaccharide pyruvyl transferase family protein [Synechococcus sp. BA-132 BA5]MEA5416113.1 polysaccharide pyruvyl transferase family protein [Synechococcus sp. BA-132 BA5]
MRIGLINAYSTLNLGDAAIYSAFRKLLPDVELVGCVQDERPDATLGVTFLPDRPRNCEAYVSVGGDIFNNSREWFVTKAFLMNLAELRHSPNRTILFGQSIPRSCHGLSFYLLQRYFKRLAAVCVRDAESHKRLCAAGVQARLSYDIAFVLETSSTAEALARQCLQRLAIEPSQAAMLSVRGFDSMYGHDNDAFVSRMAQLSHELTGAGLRPIVLIQSGAYGSDNDLDMAAAIQERAPGTAILNPFVADPAVPSWQLAMALFALVDSVIAVRFHTAVLSLAAGRVPYQLHYSNKGRDLCQRLDLPGCDLASLEPASALPEILATRGRPFNHQPVRQQVGRDFQWCLDQLPGAA